MQSIFWKRYGNWNEKKTEIVMDKPIAVGQAILDISKTLMYEFHYDYLKPKYQDKSEIVLHGYW